MTRPATTEELFGQAGGGAPLYFNKHSQIGDSVEGTVVESAPTQARDFETNAPKFWDDGSPMMQLVVTLKTSLRDATVEDDDGRRRVFLRWWGTDRANVIDATQRAGDQYVRDGAWMRVTYTGLGEAKGKLNAPRIYGIEYRAVSDTERLMTNGSVSTLGKTAGAPATQPAAPTQQPARDAVSDAADVQNDRKAMIEKVRKLAQAGFEEPEIASMVTGLSREAISAILAI